MMFEKTVCPPYQAFIWDSWGTCGLHRQQPTHSLVITPLPAGWTHGWIRKRFSWLPWKQWVGRGPRNLPWPTGAWELRNSQRVRHAHCVQAMWSSLPGSLHLERHPPKEAGRALPSGITASFTDLGTSVNNETQKTGIASQVYLPSLHWLIYLLTFRKCIFKRYSVAFLPSGRPPVSICFERSCFMMAVLEPLTQSDLHSLSAEFWFTWYRVWSLNY